jgi:hypothetical protein
MPVYRITAEVRKISNIDLGEYEADSEEGAISQAEAVRRFWLPPGCEEYDFREIEYSTEER